MFFKPSNYFSFVFSENFLKSKTRSKIVAEKHVFIQILIYLRDKMKYQEDANIIQDMITDLLEIDPEIIKTKYNLLMYSKKKCRRFIDV